MSPASSDPQPVPVVVRPRPLVGLQFASDSRLLVGLTTRARSRLPQSVSVYTPLVAVPPPVRAAFRQSNADFWLPLMPLRALPMCWRAVSHFDPPARAPVQRTLYSDRRFSFVYRHRKRAQPSPTELRFRQTPLAPGRDGRRFVAAGARHQAYSPLSNRGQRRDGRSDSARGGNR